jgi:hypothetical protein
LAIKGSEMTKDLIVEFTPEQIKHFQQKYGFDDKYDLESELDHIAMFFEKPKYFDPPKPVVKQRKLFQTIKKSATKLEDALKSISDDELLLIGGYDSHWNRATAIEAVKHLKLTAEFALNNLVITFPKGGRPPKETERKRHLVQTRWHYAL